MSAVKVVFGLNEQGRREGVEGGLPMKNDQCVEVETICGELVLTVRTPRRTGACADRSWCAELTDQWRYRFLEKSADTATKSQQGFRHYYGLRPNKTYFYGDAHCGGSNHSYTRRHGAYGAFRLGDGGEVEWLTEQQREEIRAKMRAVQETAKQEATAEAAAQSRSQGYCLLVGTTKQVAYAEVLRADALQRHLKRAEDWIRAESRLPADDPRRQGAQRWPELLDRAGKLIADAHWWIDNARYDLGLFLENAERRLAAEEQRRKAESHQLCVDFPGRVTDVTDDEIRIVTRYGEALVQTLKGIGAKWNRNLNRWCLPVHKEQDLRAILVS
jgi:hypothetical protein